MSDLKPCPFCDGDAEVLRSAGGPYEVHVAVCPLSKGGCGARIARRGPERVAVAAWNKRVGNAHVAKRSPTEWMP